MAQPEIIRAQPNIVDLPLWYSEMVLMEAKAKTQSLRDAKKLDDLLDIAEQDGD